VRVIVNPEPWSRFLYVYKATIPSAFLDKFESPSRFSPSEPIQIEYSKLFVKEPDKLLKDLPRLLDLSAEQCQGVVEEESHSEENLEDHLPTPSEQRDKPRKKEMTGFEDASRQSPTPGERREKKSKKRARELVDPSSQLPTPSELRKKKHKKG
jgi:hypothetical protein